MKQKCWIVMAVSSVLGIILHVQVYAYVVHNKNQKNFAEIQTHTNTMMTDATIIPIPSILSFQSRESSLITDQEKEMISRNADNIQEATVVDPNGNLKVVESNQDAQSVPTVSSPSSMSPHRQSQIVQPNSTNSMQSAPPSYSGQTVQEDIQNSNARTVPEDIRTSIPLPRPALPPSAPSDVDSDNQVPSTSSSSPPMPPSPPLMPSPPPSTMPSPSPSTLPSPPPMPSPPPNPLSPPPHRAANQAVSEAVPVQRSALPASPFLDPSHPNTT